MFYGYTKINIQGKYLSPTYEIILKVIVIEPASLTFIKIYFTNFMKEFSNYKNVLYK